MLSFAWPTIEGKTGGLQPLLVARLMQLARLLRPEGIGFRVVSGLRSLAKQKALYDAWKAGKSKLPAANPASCVYHCKGLAADVQLYDIASGSSWPTFGASTPWAAFGKAAEACGLTWGGRWGTWGVEGAGWDPVHVELRP